MLENCISELLDTCISTPTVDIAYQLTTEPQAIKRYGRCYCRIFLYEAVRLCIHLLDRRFIVEYPAGWNIFNIPDGSLISILEGENTPILLRLSDI